jgi:hypothetical protein
VLTSTLIFPARGQAGWTPSQEQAAGDQRAAPSSSMQNATTRRRSGKSPRRHSSRASRPGILLSAKKVRVCLEGRVELYLLIGKSRISPRFQEIIDEALAAGEPTEEVESMLLARLTDYFQNGGTLYENDDMPSLNE